MEPGSHVMVRAKLPSTDEYHCKILDVPDNRERAACKCGQPGCQEYLLLEQLDAPGILRHVGQCRMTPTGKKSAVRPLALPAFH